jgi:hypothetical protein
MPDDHDQKAGRENRRGGEQVGNIAPPTETYTSHDAKEEAQPQVGHAAPLLGTPVTTGRKLGAARMVHRLR